MASTNKTTNYDLSQFIETDKPGWLTDYNGDMRKLDAALKAISDIANGASGNISSLLDRMTAAEGGITTNANDIDALEARADSLEAQAQSSAGTIAGIQTEQITQNAGIEAATELGYNLARPYDSASTYAVGAYVLFQNTLYKCITAVSTGEAFDPTKWLAIKATDEIASGGVQIVSNTGWTISNPTVTPGTGVTLSPSATYTARCNAIRINNTQLFSLSQFFIPLTALDTSSHYISVDLPVDPSYLPMSSTAQLSISCSAASESGGNTYITASARAELSRSNNMLHITFWFYNKEVVSSSNSIRFSATFLYEV